ncbi:hypothetical protein, partial [Cohnella sp.]|uniref:hypothetical protein n=1 Tax=Cohnella sp. TaxID=1883426 RepID=UPI003565650E
DLLFEFFAVMLSLLPHTGHLIFLLYSLSVCSYEVSTFYSSSRQTVIRPLWAKPLGYTVWQTAIRPLWAKPLGFAVWQTAIRPLWAKPLGFTV